MTYILTTTQKAVLQGLVDNEDWPTAYALLGGYLTDPVDNGDVASGVKTWIEMAGDINSDSGGWWSEYVRKYTIDAATDKGNPITEADFQDASDLIAENFFSDLLDPPPGSGRTPGEVMGIEDIIENDVLTGVDALGIDDEDWAGTLAAYAAFGYDAISEFVDTPLDLLEQLNRHYWTIPETLYDIPLEIADWVNGLLDLFNDALGTTSPLVLDLDGDGIELSALSGAGSTYWDIDVDGFAEASGWVTGGDGLLAIDLNGDGLINDNSELFGNNATYANGFAALGAYDTNNDNAITSSDTQFNDLVVWVDADTDGYTDSGELHSLSSLGITSISIAYTDVNYQISGNDILQESTFTINGNTHDIVDAWFAYDNANTVYDDAFTLDLETLLLPSLRGYGDLATLHVAMSQDASLMTAVEAIASADAATILSESFDLQSKMEDILFKWAGIEGVSATSRGPYIDAQHLEFLEKLLGVQWVGPTGLTYPQSAQADILEGAYQKAFAALTAGFLVQTEANHIFPSNATYNILTGEIENANIIDYVHFADNYSTNINGSEDRDVYVYHNGDGDKTIYEDGGAEDVLYLGSGITAGDVSFWNLGGSGGNLLVRIGSDEITINDHLDESDESVETLLFADGTSIDLINGLTFIGTSSNESVYGSTADNVLSGAGGSDNLYGYEGDDIYQYGLGDGNDTIHDKSGSDQIQLGSEFSAEDIRFWKTGNDLHIYSKLDSGRIVIDDHFRSSNTEEIETLVFSDGSEIDLMAGLTFTGTSSGETVRGAETDDTLVGKGGLDKLYGYGGADTFVLEAGSAFNNVDQIKDFDQSENDVIDISDLLSAYDPISDAIADFVSFSESGGDTYIAVDQDGTGTTYSAQDVVMVDGVTGLNLGDMISSGELIV